MAHDAGDLTPQIKLANAIRVMELANLVAVGSTGDLLGPGGQWQEHAPKDNEEEATSRSPAGHGQCQVMHSQPSSMRLALASDGGTDSFNRVRIRADQRAADSKE